MSKRLEDFGNDESVKPKGLDANIIQISSDTSILPASSSSNSKNLVPLSSQPMPMSADETCHIASNTCPVSYNIWGLIFITFALFLTMFCGKTIAILFALIWLYTFPLRRWET